MLGSFATSSLELAASPNPETLRSWFVTRRRSWFFNSQRQAGTDRMEFLQLSSLRSITGISDPKEAVGSRGTAAEKKSCLTAPAAPAAATTTTTSDTSEESRRGQLRGKSGALKSWVQDGIEALSCSATEDPENFTVSAA
ncbi:hypothetical protein NXF25_011212 [Crotalus adamanteus]|uniref:Uncharacterized protein n=1 Tax=Crotalus adamanteus TaxID=8729 RepID=A0AAW1BEQ1_CROAD